MIAKYSIYVYLHIYILYMFTYVIYNSSVSRDGAFIIATAARSITYLCCAHP